MSNDKVVFRAAVFAIVRNERGEVLLHRRRHTDYMDGYYDFPSGHIEMDEGFTAATVRELAEETSLRAEESDLRLMHLGINHTDYPYITAVFAVEKWRGTPRILEPEKCDAMGFFPIDELPEKCTLTVRYVERAGFDTPIATSYIDKDGFKRLIGVDCDEVTG